MKVAFKYRKTRQFILTAGLFAATIFSTAHAAQTTYRLTDLGALTYYGSSFATDINNHGQIVGYGYEADRIEHAYIWNNGVLSTLPSHPDRAWSFAAAINDSGVVVGRTTDTMNSYATQWDKGQLTTLPSEEYFRVVSRASDINNQGTVVGHGDNGRFASVWTNGQNQVLPHLSLAATASGINNQGQVVGYSVPNNSYVYHAVMWSGGQVFDLGAPEGFTDSYAYKINDQSDVVGQSRDKYSGTLHATLWRDGQIIDLGSLNGGLQGSIANDINNLGQIIGSSRENPADENSWSTAVIWSDSLSPVALASLIDPLDPLHGSVYLNEALAINDLGQIVGNGLINGQRRAFLLTPIAAVPEPSAYALLGIGLGLIGVAARRRKSS